MSKLGLGQFDDINQMITLTVITLSGFHCILSYQCYARHIAIITREVITQAG